MYHITIQQIAGEAFAPKTTLLRKWAKKTLAGKATSAEITIRIVDTSEMAKLNNTYRHKQGPTNVLSFPYTLEHDTHTDTVLLGDIVICAEVVNLEAKKQDKLLEAHWAHIVIHGMLHLLGYDHETDPEATVMEAIEVNIMEQLGFSNPYLSGETLQDHD